MALGMSVFSVSMLATTVLELPSGLASDTMGRKQTLIWGVISSLAYTVCYAIGQNIAVLYLGAVLEGLSIALFSGNNDALLYDLLKSEGAEATYKIHLGRISSMSHMALAIASVLGGIILHFSSYSVVMWLSVLPKCICLFLAFGVDEPERAEAVERHFYLGRLGEVMREVRQNPRLAKLIIADGLAGGVGEASYQFRSLFLRMVWPVWAIGLAGTLSDIFASVSYWFSGKIITKIGAKRVIIGEKIYSLCCNVLAYAMGNWFSPLLLNSTALFFGLTNVAKNDLSQQLYSDQYRASLASVKSLTYSLLYGVFAVVIGFIGDQWGIIAALLSFQLVNVIPIVLYLDIFRERNLSLDQAI